MTGHSRRTPMRARLLPADLHPPAEITGFDPSRPIPPDTTVGPQEPEPPQQIHPIGTDRGFRSSRRQQIPEVGGDHDDGHAIRIKQLIRLVPIARHHQLTGPRNHQCRQIPLELTISDHER